MKIETDKKFAYGHDEYSINRDRLQVRSGGCGIALDFDLTDITKAQEQKLIDALQYHHNNRKD